MAGPVPKQVLDANRHVFPLELDGRQVFVKKRRAGKNPLGKFFQNILYRLTGNLLILPPLQPENGTARHEAAALREFAALGLNVPEVIYGDDDYFVMSDAGSTLEFVLRDNPGEKDYYIGLAAAELGRLHRLGRAHGGAQIKNIAVKDGRVFFIDLEERIPEGLVDKFQVRDLFLFLLSLERHGFDPDIGGIVEAYRPGDGKATAAELAKSIRGLRAVRFFDHPLFAKMKLRDIRAVSRLVTKAERMA